MSIKGTISVAHVFDLDKLLPGDDMDHDPRWVRTEIAEGLFMWDWNPATVDYTNGAYVAEVGARIERFTALEAAEWWCTDVMDVQPVISDRATQASTTARVRLGTLIDLMEAAR